MIKLGVFFVYLKVFFGDFRILRPVSERVNSVSAGGLHHCKPRARSTCRVSSGSCFQGCPGVPSALVSPSAHGYPSLPRAARPVLPAASWCPRAPSAQCPTTLKLHSSHARCLAPALCARRPKCLSPQLAVPLTAFVPSLALLRDMAKKNAKTLLHSQQKHLAAPRTPKTSSNATKRKETTSNPTKRHETHEMLCS